MRLLAGPCSPPSPPKLLPARVKEGTLAVDAPLDVAVLLAADDPIAVPTVSPAGLSPADLDAPALGAPAAGAPPAGPPLAAFACAPEGPPPASPPPPPWSLA